MAGVILEDEEEAALFGFTDDEEAELLAEVPVDESSTLDGLLSEPFFAVLLVDANILGSILEGDRLLSAEEVRKEPLARAPRPGRRRPGVLRPAGEPKPLMLLRWRTPVPKVTLGLAIPVTSAGLSRVSKRPEPTRVGRPMTRREEGDLRSSFKSTTTKHQVSQQQINIKHTPPSPLT